MSDTFTWSHEVSEEDLNPFGGVDFLAYHRWQATARHAFLQERCPIMLRLMEKDIELVTRYSACSYIESLRRFDVVEMRFRVRAWRCDEIHICLPLVAPLVGGRLVAKGAQRIRIRWLHGDCRGWPEEFIAAVCRGAESTVPLVSLTGLRARNEIS